MIEVLSRCVNGVRTIVANEVIDTSEDSGSIQNFPPLYKHSSYQDFTLLTSKPHGRKPSELH